MDECHPAVGSPAATEGSDEPALRPVSGAAPARAGSQIRATSAPAIGESDTDQRSDGHGLHEGRLRGLEERGTRVAAHGGGDRGRADERVLAAAAASPGSPAVADVIVEAYIAAKMLPRIATPERPADLADRVVDRGADAELLLRQGAHDRVGRRRHRERDPGGEDEQHAADVEVGRADADGREEAPYRRRRSSRPAAVVTRARASSSPWRRPARPRMTPIAIGMNRRPVSNADRPSTPCRYCVRKNSAPISEKKTRVTLRLAAVNRGFEKSRTSSIGWAIRRSQAKNDRQEDGRRDASEPMTSGSSQPWAGISMMP